MRALLPIAVALLLPAAPRAAEDLLARDTVEVASVAGPLAADPGAAFWGSARPLEVAVVPQRTVRLHDREANAALASAGPRAVQVRAATDGKDLAVLLEWSDATEDRAAGGETDAFGDAAALQLPLALGAGKRLPYVGMGDETMKVAVHLARAAPDGAVLREAIGAGFGALARADLGGAKVAMRHDAARGAWRAVFVRPLAAGGLELRRALVPIAVAVWDGAGAQRGGNKVLSGWKLLRLPGFPADAPYAAELAQGRGAEERGDAARGRQLVLSMCTACHAVEDRRAARPGIAPELTGIGAIATPAYLRESIVAPSAIVVPGPNPAQHQDRAKAPGVAGAYPVADAFTWWRTGPDGKRISKMPPYAGLPEPDVRAMVTYLASLGAEPPEGRKP